ncbi:choline kinase [Coleophoma crateriformis]|uniref:Choline kinase n=1 Tax=Coleophoma crateriformis TaxID=565419 RepID=A0A3D8T266_9HELO|nr:choline kinase [Coleophoma crateriformis]
MASQTDSSGSSQPVLRPALRPEGDEVASPKSGATKMVSIAEPAEDIPLTFPTEEVSRRKQFTASIAKRMTGRPTPPSTASSRVSTTSQGSTDETNLSPETSSHHRGDHKHGHRHHQHHHDRLLSQVAEWLQAEKAKKAARKSHKRGSKEDDGQSEELGLYTGRSGSRPSSRGSDSSSISLEKLQRILEDSRTAFGHDLLPLSSPVLRPKMPSHSSRRRSSARSLRGHHSSDTEYQDGDVVVPTCDVVLDNSKTMSYTGGSSTDTPTLSSGPRIEKERKGWLTFKSEIVRLAHTLRLKGWRRVPLERGGDIDVERLSGALTNAVYVVCPPKDLDRPPPKLLLRIYGPQVEHLIDRENELGILRRLARKKIGPRLLGTFKNGRFEEFFNAQTLTAADLRVEATSKQIAKRMRELHDGIELLEREREQGPFVWLNWDKWVDRVEEVVTYLDKQIKSGGKRQGERWRERGLVCGVEWPMFKATIEKYRAWLDEYYGGHRYLMDRLVFAHNDTQYGNILRIIPESKDGSAPSPLLLPQNTHKQLVVIDFEYASANTPGLEFANHFTEWCYNYHHPTASYACNTEAYPTRAQQETFIRSYVNHRPQFNPLASATPKLSSGDSNAGAPGSISAFMLDSRTPSGTEVPTRSNYAEEEARREKDTENKVQALMEEVRVWRIANSAQWVAWGIVQAEIPELSPAPAPSSPVSESTENGLPKPPGHLSSDDLTEENQAKQDAKEHDKRPEGLVAEALLQNHKPEEVEKLHEQEEADEEEFDYLAYAQERAMFFWGDVLSLGLVKKEDLPEELLSKLKFVEY